MIRRSFVLGTAGAALSPPLAWAADTISGRYAANGKDASLSFVSAWPRDKFAGREAIVVVLTEKDHSASKKPEFDASLGQFGAALTISLFTTDGEIFGSQITHPGLKRSSASVSGSIVGEGVKVVGDRVQGRFKTKGAARIFDETLDLDIQLAADIRPRPA